MKYQQVSWELANNGFVGVPKRTGGKVMEVCRTLVENPAPIFVPLRPSADAAVSQCYFNVEKQVAQFGGEMVFGWGIWEWPGVFLEFEHHCVWKKDEQLIDLTPTHYGRDQILFLPDPSRPYDFVTKERINSQRVATRRSPYIEAWLSATGQMLAIRQAIPLGETVELSDVDSARFRSLERQTESAKRNILIELANRTPPTEPCICGSGRRFEKCCVGHFS